MFLNKSKIYSFIIIVFPFLSLYSFLGSSVVSVAHVLYAIVCIALGFGLIKKGTLDFGFDKQILSVFLLVMVFNTFYIMQLADASDLIPRNLLHIGFLLTIILFSQFIDCAFAFKIFRFACLFSSAYIIIQMLIILIFHRYLPGVIPGLGLVRADLNSFYEDALRWGINARPRSIFGEGAEYAQYNILYLGFIINRRERKFLSDKLIISAGVLLSASNIGILGLCILWGYFLVINGDINRLLGFSLVASIALVFAYKVGILDTVINRLFDISSGTLELGMSFTGRIGGYLEYLQGDINLLQLLFGNGIILLADGGFQPSTLCTFISYGLVGLIPFLTLFFHKIKISTNRIVWICLFMFSIFGNLFYWHFCLFSYSIMFADFDESVIDEAVLKTSIQENLAGGGGIGRSLVRVGQYYNIQGLERYSLFSPDCQEVMAA